MVKSTVAPNDVPLPAPVLAAADGAPTELAEPPAAGAELPPLPLTKELADKDCNNADCFIKSTATAAGIVVGTGTGGFGGRI